MSVKHRASHAVTIRVHAKKGQIMKILLPVDGSDYTKRMLAVIAARDELLGPNHEYVVLNVVTPVPSYATRFLEHATVEGYYREQAEAVLGPVKQFADQQHWPLRVAHAHGNAAEAIAAFANTEKVDLIVMGSHGHSALGNVLLGSVASGVLARCKVPVLLVR
jgi:nucleotide-binding universal stress UspA family protein